MKIHLRGLRLELNQKLTLSELVAQLKTYTQTPYPHGGFGRIFKVEEDRNHLIGCVMTVRDQGKFPEIDTASLQMSVRQLEDGKSLADFNFFVISKRNLNGLYTHYKGSCSFGMFDSLLNSLGRGVTEPKRRDELHAVASTGTQKRKERETIRERYKFAVHLCRLVSLKHASEIVEHWKRLKALQFTVTRLEPEIDDFGGLKSFVRAKTTKLSFDKDSAFERLKSALLSFISTADCERATIDGVDESGVERTLDLLETTGWFGQCDYTNILDDETLFTDNLRDCCLVKMLLEKVLQHREYFDVDVQ